MADIKNAYVASSAVIIGLDVTPLASSATHTAGRESAEIDNSSNLYPEYLLSGKITTGTSPTDAREIRIYLVAEASDTAWPDVFDGTDSDETVTDTEVRDSVCRLAHVMSTDTTSDQAYWFSGISVREVFGGTCPRKFVVFVTHDTGVALNTTAANHVLTITPVYQTAT